MAGYYKMFEDNELVFSEEETEKFVQSRRLFEAFCQIITQNNTFIALTEMALKATGAARTKCVEKMCRAFVPGHDFARNFSRCALDTVREELLEAGHAGILNDLPYLFGVFRLVCRTTATLFDRLQRFEDTVELQEARIAIDQIFDFLISEEGFGHFSSEKTFVIRVDRAFESFFHACEENVKVLRGKYLSGQAKVEKAIKCVDEKADHILFEATNHEYGKPPKDGRRMKEKGRAMVEEAVVLVVNKGYTKIAAAKEVVKRHLHDREGTAYGANQVGALRIALTRELARRRIE
jgi:hypothetical protein